MDQMLAGMLRRADPDRYFTALFAPAAYRATLFTLYAFNHELARAREVTREPGLALIRLHWWREVVEGASRAHEVAAPLRDALDGNRLHAPDLLAMIDAREIEVEGDFATVPRWHQWLLQGAGSLAVAAGRALGAPDNSLDGLRARGAGYALAGQLRNIAAFARQGRCLLPADALAEHGLTGDSIVAGPHESIVAGPHDRNIVAGPHESLLAEPHGRRVEAVCANLARQGLALLGPARPCGDRWIAAALPAVLGRRDLARPGHAAPRRLADRVAVAVAALRRSA